MMFDGFLQIRKFHADSACRSVTLDKSIEQPMGQLLNSMCIKPPATHRLWWSRDFIVALFLV